MLNTAQMRDGLHVQPFQLPAPQYRIENIIMKSALKELPPKRTIGIGAHTSRTTPSTNGPQTRPFSGNLEPPISSGPLNVPPSLSQNSLHYHIPAQASPSPGTLPYGYLHHSARGTSFHAYPQPLRYYPYASLPAQPNPGGVHPLAHVYEAPPNINWAPLP